MTQTIATGRLIALALALVAVGCFTPEPPTGLPCTADHRCPDGQTCDLVTNVCTGPTSDGVWRDDTAADFGQPGAVLDGVSVEEPGAIAPTPYFTGGLRLTATASARFAEVDGASWEALAGAVPSGRGFVRYVGFDVGGGRLAGVGLDADASEEVTAWIEGEVWLTAGEWRFELDAGGVGFVDLDSGDGFERLATGDNQATADGLRVIAADGWYPIRGAVADVDDWFYFYLAASDDGAPGWIDPERLRARVDDVHGVVLDGFDDPYTLYPTATAISQSPLTAATVDAEDLEVGEGDWSVRYTGQVRVDVGGSYVLEVDSYAGHRLWIDGELELDDLGYDAVVNRTEALALDAGWHDVVIEQMWSSPESPRLALTVVSGPELVGAGFPLERTRPVVGRGVRWVSNSCWYEDVPDSGEATCAAWVGLPSGATALDANLGWEVDHPVLSSLLVTLTSPDETTIALAQPGDLTGGGTASDHLHIDVASGAEVEGWWHLGMTDTVTDMMVGHIDALSITTTYRGGEAPFAAVSTFTSAVRELGDLTSFGDVAWAVRQGAASDAVVRLRTGATAEACAAAAWVVVTPGPVPSTVAPLRFAQYQVELHSDGDVPTALEWIELRYRRAE